MLHRRQQDERSRDLASDLTDARCLGQRACERGARHPGSSASASSNAEHVTRSGLNDGSGSAGRASSQTSQVSARCRGWWFQSWWFGAWWLGFTIVVCALGRWVDGWLVRWWGPLVGRSRSHWRVGSCRSCDVMPLGRRGRRCRPGAGLQRPAGHDDAPAHAQARQLPSGHQLVRQCARDA